MAMPSITSFSVCVSPQDLAVLKGMRNDYVEIQWKSMQVIFIMFWCVCVRGSLCANQHTMVRGHVTPGIQYVHLYSCCNGLPL